MVPTEAVKGGGHVGDRDWTRRRRLAWVSLAALLTFALLIGRLGYIQLVQSPWLTQRAMDSWRRDIPVEPKRGTVYDRNGHVLAYNVSAPTVVAVPAQIRDKTATAARLAAVLNVSEQRILSLISKRTLMVYVAGGRKIDDAKAKAVRDLHLPGVYITEEGRRYYPFGELAAHVLGFVGIDNQGLAGLEAEYDARLRGFPGAISFFANAKGEAMPGTESTYIPPQPGEDVYLTLDEQISSFVRREIDRVVAEYHPDSVTAVVADPATGEILAMENAPTFNPANYQDYPHQVYDRNLAIWKTFEPGSTFKIVTLSAALQENKIRLDERFFDPGYFEVAGHRIRCWKAGGHGSESFLEVVENSCNPGFMLMGQRLGKDALFHYIRAFGFGSKTGIDLPGEGSGILFKLSRVGPLELATTSFGQGVSVTPIQQVVAVSAVANGGALMKPYVAAKWVDHETGQVISERQPTPVRRVISPQTAELVRGALESVVARGTGKNAYSEGYRVAGKTGTAQVVGPDGHYMRNHYIVSFIGMAPADHPRLVAYVAVDNPKAPVIFGGVIAAPVVGHILADSLQYLGVPPSSQGIPREYGYLDTKPVEVPDVSGRSLDEARRTMLESSAQLYVATAGQGDYVIAQAPQAGTKVPPGTMVRIYLGPKPAGAP
ncbi:stage V sporulation protein D [Kyrpidia spormannii]|uniref:stage V sporulation protein D n=1 Tax=Kyrpidia spormannii TaxID=2055160 RepID=UPI0039EB1DCB